jgi:hypothetical protein
VLQAVLHVITALLAIVRRQPLPNLFCVIASALGSSRSFSAEVNREKNR